MLRDCSFAFKFRAANHNASSIFSANRVEGALLESVQNFDEDAKVAFLCLITVSISIIRD